MYRFGHNHIYSVYGKFGRETTEYMVIYSVYIYGSGQPYKYVRNYGVYMVSSLAGKLPCSQSCTVLIYTVLASPIYMYVIMVYLWSHH